MRCAVVMNRFVPQKEKKNHINVGYHQTFVSSDRNALLTRSPEQSTQVLIHRPQSLL